MDNKLDGASVPDPPQQSPGNMSTPVRHGTLDVAASFVLGGWKRTVEINDLGGMVSAIRDGLEASPVAEVLLRVHSVSPVSPEAPRTEPVLETVDVLASFVLGGWKRTVNRHDKQAVFDAIRDGLAASPVIEVLVQGHCEPRLPRLPTMRRNMRMCVCGHENTRHQGVEPGAATPCTQCPCQQFVERLEPNHENPNRGPVDVAGISGAGVAESGGASEAPRFIAVCTHPLFEDWWRWFGATLASDGCPTEAVALGAWGAAWRRGREEGQELNRHVSAPLVSEAQRPTLALQLERLRDQWRADAAKLRRLGATHGDTSDAAAEDEAHADEIDQLLERTPHRAIRGSS